MKTDSEWLESLGCLMWLPFIMGVFILFPLLLNAGNSYEKLINGDLDIAFKMLSAFTMSAIVLLFWRVLYIKGECKAKIEESNRKIEANNRATQKEKERLTNAYEKEKGILTRQFEEKKSNLERREEIIKNFIKSLDKETFCAELIADLRTMVYQNTSDYLLTKVYAAPSAAESVRQLRTETREYIEELKKLQYTFNQRISLIESDANNRISLIESDAERRVAESRRQEQLAKQTTKQVCSMMQSKTPFRDIAELYSNAISVAYGSIADILKEKVRPARSLANEIEQKLKTEIREYAFEAKNLRYRWDFLLKIFPDIRQYLDEDESLISLAEFKGISDFNEGRDRARDYLSDEEWNCLSTLEKYQRALDNYKARPRYNSWVAGSEYEMYCSYILKKDGYTVIDHGVKMRKADLGRDIIAFKDGNTYIIQCKRYSTKNRDGTPKYVHENIICQLYGTTIEYQISNPDNTLFAQQNKIIPVLFTTGRLSEMAKSFASKLGVEVFYYQMGDYPMIKCNINNGQKIYHLPFDQQYWNTEISKDGETYAWTVKEAEEKRFRRAMRHTFPTKPS